MKDLQIIKGIECFEDESGMIQLNLEQVARGLGFTQEKNKVEYVRWDRLNSYLESFGFSPQAGKEVFIPEPIFYMLAMKAESEQAKKFQKIVAYEILPEIRKTGTYTAPKLSKEIQAIFVLDEKQQKLEHEVKDLKDNMPLFNTECKELSQLVRRKGTQLLGGKGVQAYKDASLRSKVYSDIYGQLKREFGVVRYESIKRCQLEKATYLVNYYSLPLVLENEIILLNNQVQF